MSQENAVERLVRHSSIEGGGGVVWIVGRARACVCISSSITSSRVELSTLKQFEYSRLVDGCH